MTRPLVLTRTFERALRRFTRKNPDDREAIREALGLLHADAFDPRLHMHKLKGAFEGVWSSSAGYDIRILFTFEIVNNVESIVLKTIGTHDDVY